MLESWIQSKVIKYLQKKWYIVIKHIKCNITWLPDIQVLTWNWQTFFIEIKQEKWKESKIQEYQRQKLINFWYSCIITYWYNDFIDKFKELWNQLQK
jgi:hypothetical protein